MSLIRIRTYNRQMTVILTALGGTSVENQFEFITTYVRFLREPTKPTVNENNFREQFSFEHRHTHTLVVLRVRTFENPSALIGFTKVASCG